LSLGFIAGIENIFPSRPFLHYFTSCILKLNNLYQRLNGAMIITLQQMLEKGSPVIFDGAMATQIQEYGVNEKDYQGHIGCNEILNFTKPDVILEIHKEYFKAGAHVVESNTFGANRVKLTEYGLEEKTYEINKTAALIARQAVHDACRKHSCFVCGSMGPTGHLPSSAGFGQGSISFDSLASIFTEQASGLLDGGVDMLLLETMQDLLEVRAAIYGIRKLMRERKQNVPIQVHVSIDAAGRMLLGSDMRSFLGAVGNLSPVAIGFNCGVGPHEMGPHIIELLRKSHFPVSMMPNAGMPENVDGKALYKMGADEFARAVAPLVENHGLAIVGGCCGTTPAHIKALSQALEGRRPARRQVSMGTYVSTGITGTDLEALAKPIIIGERLNVQGSKKTKELVLAHNLDELYQIALQQAQRGSALIDLCLAVNERDVEKEMLAELAGFLAQRVSVPFCLDSTEQAVIERALKACPGSALINSINFERKGEKARPLLELARDFGCPVIALTIDDEGMAKTMKSKLELTGRLRDLACGEFGLPEHFLYVDPLTFTLATGDPESADAAKISIEAVFRIKDEMPRVRTVLGVSNVSYGLATACRKALNNLMLHHAAKAGLDAAIFNPLQVENVADYPVELRLRAENLLFNRTKNALADFINYFEKVSDAPSEALSVHGIDAIQQTHAQQLRGKIIQRDRRGLRELIETILTVESADSVLNTILLPAMEEVGEKMARGEMILPFVLQAAEVMKESLEVLGPYLKKNEAQNRGRIILATVYGDVHDIGKNLVGSILKNQGFEIIDLGKQVPLETIIETVERERPDALGLSALLVMTSREMRRCVEECHRRGYSVPIIIGGAAVNKAFADRIVKIDDTHRYAGGVFYAKDAFEAAKVLDEVKKKPVSLPPVKSAPESKAQKNVDLKATTPPQLDYGELLVPHFYGTSEVLRWDTKTLLDSVDTTRLFKGHWGGGNLSGEDFAKSADQEFLPAFERLKNKIMIDALIEAKGLYGFFPVYSKDDTLFLLDPGDFHTELVSFQFPRMVKKHNRSLADFFRPEGDIIGLQIVTLGKGVGERSRRYISEESNYTFGFYLNGIGNYLTERLADLVTAEIRRGLFIGRDQGKRYSFGYPGLPGVEDQAKLFEIMGVEDRMGITLTPGFQMEPEHSTMAVFIHHPEAQYP
jgi:5-methyltetrahydrofolate--homocysteine methyltransferase